MKPSVLSKLSLLLVVAIISLGFLNGSTVLTNSPGGFNAGMTRAVGVSDSMQGKLRLVLRAHVIPWTQRKVLILGAQW